MARSQVKPDPAASDLRHPTSGTGTTAMATSFPKLFISIVRSFWAAAEVGQRPAADWERADSTSASAADTLGPGDSYGQFGIAAGHRHRHGDRAGPACGTPLS